MVTNIKSMIYYGSAPWHNLGTKLDNPATAEEAIEHAGLDFSVIKEPIYTKHNLLIDDSYVTVRDDLQPHDPERILGIVGKKYVPLQNIEAFSFFDSIVGEGQAIYHTAGALGHGEKIWLLAKLPGEIIVAGDDITEKYLLLSNSHDGSSCVRCKFTPIRVVCQNTLNAALRQKSPEIQVRHTQSAEIQLKIAGKLIKEANYHFANIAEAFKLLAKTQINQSELDEFLKELVPDNKDAKNNSRTENIRNKITGLFEYGKGNDMPSVRHTFWTAYNASTEYVDYARNTNGDPNNRLKSIWFGSGADFKQRAFSTAMRMAEAKAC